MDLIASPVADDISACIVRNFVASAPDMDFSFMPDMSDVSDMSHTDWSELCNSLSIAVGMNINTSNIFENPAVGIPILVVADEDHSGNTAVMQLDHRQELSAEAAVSKSSGLQSTSGDPVRLADRAENLSQQTQGLRELKRSPSGIVEEKC